MKIKQKFHEIKTAFVDVFYPNQCQICQTQLNFTEKHICLSCAYDLPFINDSEMISRQLCQIFWGRVEIKKVYSLFDYQKGNQVQDILHQLKYKGKFRLGNYFGEMLGETIPNGIFFDAIVPVPLHPKKQLKRGFNQSEAIAQGISKSIGVNVKNKWIQRTAYNDSQTKFTKYDRWDNVRSIFKVMNEKKLRNKHILLVDDVLTTGATVESCAQEMAAIENCSVSIATLAARL